MSNLFIKIHPEDKARVKSYLDATYKGNMSDFVRRLIFQKVSEWEAEQREEQRLEEEHQAKIRMLNKGYRSARTQKSKSVNSLPQIRGLQ